MAVSRRVSLRAALAGGLVWLLLLALVAFLRLPSFEMSVVDWDESVYLLMADSFLHGQGLYIAVWDHKPPGIYLLFALALSLFGRSILAIRLASWLAVSASCFLLYLFGKNRLGERGRGQGIGLLAALLYAVFSLFSGGFAANSEIYFAPLAILAFYWLWPALDGLDGAKGASAGRLLAVGLALGLALQIKLVVALDLAAALLLLLVAAHQGQGGRLRAFARAAGSVLLAALLPAAVALLGFGVAGRLPEFLDSAIGANLRYGQIADFSPGALAATLRAQARQNALLWAAAILAPLLAAAIGSGTGIRRHLGRLALWLLVVLGGILLTQDPFWHYFLQLLPPLCLIAALVIAALLDWARSLGRWRHLATAGLALLVVSGLAWPLGPALRDSAEALALRWQGVQRIDEPAYVAGQLRQRLHPGDSVYVADYQPAVYFMVDVQPPTRYVLPPWLTDQRFARFVGIDQVQELERIMQQRPAYVLAAAEQGRESPFYRRLAELLASAYELETTVQGIAFYRLRG